MFINFPAVADTAAEKVEILFQNLEQWQIMAAGEDYHELAFAALHEKMGTREKYSVLLVHIFDGCGWVTVCLNTFRVEC